MLFRSGIELVHRWLETWATVDDTTGGMTNHMDERMTDCPQESIGCDTRLLLECSMRTCNNPIELSKERVVIVECSIGENVDLTTSPNPHVGKS